MDFVAKVASRLDALDPDLREGERAAIGAGQWLLTVELPTGEDPVVVLSQKADAAQGCAEECAAAWSLPDSPVRGSGRYHLVLAIAGRDAVDAVERARWLEDEVGALDPDGSWFITPGLV